MKIILSRKGFDSSAGGYPSPILDGKRLISFPIPENPKSIEGYNGLDNKYSSLRVNDNMSYLELMHQLLPKKKKLILEENKFDLDEDPICHFDPQINSSQNCHNNSKYIGMFGQSGAANSHLRKTYKVSDSDGDLFLFFGWFRDTQKINGEYKYIPGTDKHVIWGWLQIDSIHNVTEKDKDNNDFNKHPHVWKTGDKDNNSIYLSKEKLSFNDNLPGAGIFPFHKSLVLTKKGMTRSKWDLEPFFKGKISYHNEKNFKADYFQSASRGQEFVIEANDQIMEWVYEKFNTLKKSNN